MTQTDGNIYHVLRLKEVTLSKWLYYLRQSTYSMQPYQINNDIFHKTKKNLICTKIQKTLISKSILRRKNRARAIMFPEFRPYYKLTVMKVKVKSLSHVRLFATPWTVAYQLPLSMGFSRQEYWSGLPFPSPEIFLTQGLNLGLLHCRQTLYRLSQQGSGMIMAQNRNTDQ